MAETAVPQNLRTDLTKPLTRAAEIAKEGAIDIEKRTVTVSFSSEMPVERYDWWTGESYSEILAHDDSVDLERINSVGVVAFNHNTWSLPLGSVEKAWIDQDEKRGYAVLRFDNDEDSDKVFQKIVSGTLRGVSFRYSVGVWEDVKVGKTSTCGRFQGPCKVGRQWSPMEIGPVGIPADYTVGPGRSVDESVPADSSRAEGADSAPNTEVRGDSLMEDNKTTAVDEAAVRAESIKAERERVAEITGLCREFNVDAIPHIESGVSVETVRKIILEKLADERKAAPVVKVVADESDKRRAALTDGLSLRAGIAVDNPVDGAREFAKFSLIDAVRECLDINGISWRGKDPKDYIREAIIGTSDFPSILSNIATKAMTQGYNASQSTYKSWVGIGSLADFKTYDRLRLSEFDDLSLVPEGAPYQHAAPMTEAKEQIRLYTYGKKSSLTRQAIINDDLGALTKTLAKMGMSADRLVNSSAYGVLTTNAALADAVALFHATHGNLAGSGTAITAVALAAGQAAMRKQKNIGGKEALNVAPRFLIVSPDKEFEARQLIASAVDPTKGNATPNPFYGSLTIIVDATLTGNTWYLAADPGMIDTVEVAFLNGVSTPRLERKDGWDVDGVEFKVSLDFGVKALDFRGLYKNAGA